MEARLNLAIKVRNLCKQYAHSLAVNQLSFEIETGAIVGFLGPNGAGKTTTLRILAGLLSASSGEAYVNGISLAEHREKVRTQIGYLDEGNPLFTDLSIREYLQLRAYLKAIRSPLKALAEVCELCELSSTIRKKRIKELSKGYQQRVGLAEALLGNPPILLLDDPTLGLDPHQIFSLRKILLSLKGETTILFSSHSLAEVESLSSHFLILDHGVLVGNGTLEQLREIFLPKKYYCFRYETASLPEDWHQKFSIPLRLIEKKLHENLSEVILEVEASSSFPQFFLERLKEWNLPRIEFFEKFPSLETIFFAATHKPWQLL